MTHPSLSELWSAAVERLARLQIVFGTPFAFLTTRSELFRAERRRLLRHLAPLERLVRALLLALALSEPAPPSVRRKAPRRPARTPAAPAWPGPNSGAWTGVRFRVVPAPARARTAAAGRAAPATVFYRYPLARRMEALARVLADPAPYVRRLAAMLRTRTTRMLAWVARITRPDPRAPHDLAAAQALLGGLRFNTS